MLPFSSQDHVGFVVIIESLCGHRLDIYSLRTVSVQAQVVIEKERNENNKDCVNYRTEIDKIKIRFDRKRCFQHHGDYSHALPFRQFTEHAGLSE